VACVQTAMLVQDGPVYFNPQNLLVLVSTVFQKHDFINVNPGLINHGLLIRGVLPK
jgi:hypothetical protein